MDDKLSDEESSDEEMVEIYIPPCHYYIIPRDLNNCSIDELMSYLSFLKDAKEKAGKDLKENPKIAVTEEEYKILNDEEKPYYVSVPSSSIVSNIEIFFYNEWAKSNAAPLEKGYAQLEIHETRIKEFMRSKYNLAHDN